MNEKIVAGMRWIVDLQERYASKEIDPIERARFDGYCIFWFLVACGLAILCAFFDLLGVIVLLIMMCTGCMLFILGLSCASLYIHQNWQLSVSRSEISLQRKEKKVTEKAAKPIWPEGSGDLLQRGEKE